MPKYQLGWSASLVATTLRWLSPTSFNCRFAWQNASQLRLSCTTNLTGELSFIQVAADIDIDKLSADPPGVERVGAQ